MTPTILFSYVPKKEVNSIQMLAHRKTPQDARKCVLR